MTYFLIECRKHRMLAFGMHEMFQYTILARQAYLISRSIGWEGQAPYCVLRYPTHRRVSANALPVSLILHEAHPQMTQVTPGNEKKKQVTYKIGVDRQGCLEEKSFSPEK